MRVSRTGVYAGWVPGAGRTGLRVRGRTGRSLGPCRSGGVPVHLLSSASAIRVRWAARVPRSSCPAVTPRERAVAPRRGGGSARAQDADFLLQLAGLLALLGELPLHLVNVVLGVAQAAGQARAWATRGRAHARPGRRLLRPDHLSGTPSWKRRSDRPHSDRTTPAAHRQRGAWSRRRMPVRGCGRGWWWRPSTRSRCGPLYGARSVPGWRRTG